MTCRMRWNTGLVVGAERWRCIAPIDCPACRRKGLPADSACHVPSRRMLLSALAGSSQRAGCALMPSQLTAGMLGVSCTRLSCAGACAYAA